MVYRKFYKSDCLNQFTPFEQKIKRHRPLSIQATIKQEDNGNNSARRHYDDARKQGRLQRSVR